MVNAEFFDALEQLEKEKGIPVDYMLDRVGQALITAYKRDNDGMTDNVYVEPNREEKTIRMYVRKTVVRTEDLYEPYEEITLEEAADYKVNPQVGDIIEVEMDDSHVMEASALAYMLPLAGFIVGLAAGWGLTKTGVKMNGELLMALCAVIGTAAAYFIMRAIDPKLSKGRWEQKIISVTHPEETENKQA